MDGTAIVISPKFHTTSEQYIMFYHDYRLNWGWTTAELDEFRLLWELGISIWDIAKQMKRRFVGIELKRSYYEQAVKNLETIKKELAQARLF